MRKISFFEKNLLNSTTSYVFTSALTSGAFWLYDEKDRTVLSSVGSDDLTPEVWEFEFGGSLSISAVHIGNHNLKEFSLQYWSSTAFVDFSPAVSTTTNSSFYNFISDLGVFTDRIKITMNKTMVADQEKSIGSLRIMNGLGEVSINPHKADLRYHENSRSYYTDSKENVYVLFGVSVKIDLEFGNLPPEDINILESCKYLGEPFYVYPCGGEQCSNARGWRIQDIFLCNYTNEFSPKISDNQLQNGEDIKVSLESVKTRSQ